MRPIRGLQSLQIVTPAFDESVDYYTRGFGLKLSRSDARMAVFTGAAPEHPVLVVCRGEHAKLVGLTFALSSETELRIARQELAALGYPAATHDADGLPAHALSIIDPDGRRISFDAISAVADESPKQAEPQFLSHVVLNSPNPDRLTSFFVDTLGFKIADRYEQNFLTFLRCAQPQHHCIGVSAGNTASLNHFSIDVGSIDGVMKGVGRLQKLGRQPIWGPGRHGPGGNVFCYFEDPSGFVSEFTCDVLQIEDEAAWMAKEWPRNPETGNVWGTGGPSSRAIELMSGIAQVASQ